MSATFAADARERRPTLTTLSTIQCLNLNLFFAFAVTLYRVVPKLPRSIGRSQRSKSECFARSCAARVDSLDTVLIPPIGILGAAITLIFSYLVPTMCLSSPKHFWRRSKRAKAVSTEEETKKIVLARCKKSLLITASLYLTIHIFSASPVYPYLCWRSLHKCRADLQSSRYVVRSCSIGLFVEVPKTDAKPHLFIAPSQELCAVSSLRLNDCR